MIYGYFDNRHGDQPCSNVLTTKVHLLKRIRARARGKRLPLYAGGGMHLRLPLHGRSIVYTYIRKNGCSAFKKWLRDSRGYETSKRETSEMSSHYSVSFGPEAARSEFLLVLRDPADRIASLFRNKLIQRSYAEDILANIETLTGETPDKLTFRSFVERYIGDNISPASPSANRLDAHAIPQRLHLWPVEYNKVILLADLSKAAEELFPDAISQKYFRRQRNTSSSNQTDEDSSDICVRELRENFLSTGTMPSQAAFFDSQLQSSIRSIYGCDYDLLKSSLQYRDA